MKKSRRAQRMERHHQRGRGASLNMVSLMDIFTILVFFLLVSSTSVQELPNSEKIKLPESVADKLPKETVVILVSRENILVQGRKVADVSKVLKANRPFISSLKSELDRLSARQLQVKAPDGKPVSRSVTIMGDKQIPFRLLKKIMLTCTKASYGNISLAVLKKSDKNG